MTKRDLIEEIAQRYPRFSRRDAEVMVNTVFDSMTEALARPERIEIRGFGSFIVKHRPAREGRNPRTGEVVAVAAKKVRFSRSAKSCVSALTASLLRRSNRRPSLKQLARADEIEAHVSGVLWMLGKHRMPATRRLPPPSVTYATGFRPPAHPVAPRSRAGCPRSQ